MSKPVQQKAAGPSPIERVRDRIPLDPEAIGALVDAVLGDELYWFPVRHHSPTVAAHLRRAIELRKPKLVFIEGPPEADDLVRYVTDRETRPPIAIYSSYRDDDNVLGLAGVASAAEDIPPRFASWYPLMVYSPEYVAMGAAATVGAEVSFMDLPHHALIKPMSERPDDDAVDGGDASGGDDEEEGALEAGPTSGGDALIAASSFYQTLAEVAGYRSWDEAWDSLFEFGHLDDELEAYRREVATFCAAARATSAAERIVADGTLERERFMWKTIRETLAERGLGPGDAMVVCGGFHLFLDRDDPEPPPASPDGTVFVTVMPYSYFRVSDLSGYGAGNRAPQFYQRYWELASKGRPDEILIEHAVAVIKAARKAGESLSSADAIAVAQLAPMLASLRGRPRATLDDIHDAILTCCCKGDPADEGIHLRKAIDLCDIGNRVGKVTKKLGHLPLVNDFYSQVSDLDLGEMIGKEKSFTLTLDKREETDRRRSAFLHRLQQLKVPIGNISTTSGDFDTGTIFRERWRLGWSPKAEPALIEKSLYGDSVESAALARLQEQLAKDAGHAGAVCRKLVGAIDMDLPQLVAEIEGACATAIDSDTRFISLTSALSSLVLLEKYAVYQNLNRALLAELITRCFQRACFTIPEVASVPEEDQEPVIDALKSLADAVLKDRSGEIDREVFVEQVRIAAEASTMPFMRGAFFGLLAELRDLPPEELAAIISDYAKSRPEVMVEAGDFLDGAFAASRASIMLGAEELIGALDELLRAAGWDEFLMMLPRMRGAFVRLHDRQRDSVADGVARHYGLGDSAALTARIATSVEAAAVIARIDAEVAAIMEEWEF